MRRLIYASIFLLVSGFLLQPSAQAVDKIRIGLPADAGHFTFPLAQKRGFLKEEGIEAEIITITGQVANIALTSGDIDYYTGFGSARHGSGIITIQDRGLLSAVTAFCLTRSSGA